jgi:uncharacterized repeat protein (TIGR04076 family)
MARATWRNGLWNDLPDVRVTVVDVMGSAEPPCEYVPGDSWLISSFKAPEGLCLWAISAMQFYLGAVRSRGTLLWEEDKDVAWFSCCDCDNPVVFELRRVEPSLDETKE